MRDYARMVEILRNCAKDSCETCPIGGAEYTAKDCRKAHIDAADAIEELLAAVPKNGKWIAERDGSIVELSKNGFVGDSCHCSVCNEHLDGSEEYAVKGIFCPSCGAIMNR